MRSPLPALVAVLTLGLGAIPVASGDEHAIPDEATLRAMTARFAPVDLGADLSGIPVNERKALAKIIEAARIMDTLFLRQVWAGNEALLFELIGDDSGLGEARRHAFIINKGPWSRLDHDAPFIPGIPAKPDAANFYPAGSTKGEVEVTALTAELLTIQAEGSYEKAKAILDRLAVIRPETRRVLDRLQDVPVDIEPRFVTAERLTRGQSR